MQNEAGFGNRVSGFAEGGADTCGRSDALLDSLRNSREPIRFYRML